MLTSAGRAAARRVVTSSSVANRNMSLSNTLSGRSSLVLRPATSVRSFSASPWNFEAAGSKAKKPSKAATAKQTLPKKKPQPKPKPPGRPKTKKVEPLTLEQKQAKELRQLKELGLVFKEPKLQPRTAWNIFMTEAYEGGKNKGVRATDMASRLSSDYQKISSHEKERLEIQATANKKANEEARAAWIATLPVEDVYMANLARRRLKRMFNKHGKMQPLEDDRLPKRPKAPYFVFSAERFGGEYTAENILDLSKQASKEWGALSAAEKKAYYDPYREQMEKYSQECDALKAKADDKMKAMEKIRRVASQAKRDARDGK